MKCYNCGNELGTGQFCLRCGADVSLYRRIVRLSNSYYNAGLERARLRDLTGARESLQKSLQMNKRNTDARNLLGLVYFETGEVVEALCQWVVSKDLQPENNLADDYLKQIRDGRNQLDTMNQAVKKFNQALTHARMDGKDLAVIQLKRIIKQQPKFLKAYQLLGLLYIQQEDYPKAAKVLRQGLKIDTGDTLCQKYLQEIQGKLGKNLKEEEPEKTEEKSAKTSAKMSAKSSAKSTAKAFFAPDPPEKEDVVMPPYRETPGGMRAILWVLTGIAIAMCMYQFVILRSKNRDENVQINQEIAAYDSKLADKELEMEAMRNQITELQAENERLSETVGALTGNDGSGNQYDALLGVVSQYLAGESSDSEGLVAAFSKIDETAVDSEAYQKVYAVMKEHLTVDSISDIYEEAYNLYKNYYYKKAIPVFEECLQLSPDHVDSLYYLGLCYEKRKNPEGALNCFQRIVNEFPTSEYYDNAVKKVKALGGTIPETTAATVAETVPAEEAAAEGEAAAEEAPAEEAGAEPEEGE